MSELRESCQFRDENRKLGQDHWWALKRAWAGNPFGWRHRCWYQLNFGFRSTPTKFDLNRLRAVQRIAEITRHSRNTRSLGEGNIG